MRPHVSSSSYISVHYTTMSAFKNNNFILIKIIKNKNIIGMCIVYVDIYAV